MDVRLNKLSIENFKGIETFQADFDGGHAVIKGANGTGKTTVYDAFLWLLFGKDSTGRKEFELRPLDKHNQPVKGLVLVVEAQILIEETNGNETVGIAHVFRKEHHEKVVKKQLRGYETLCYIDEVPKKVGEYAEYVNDLIPEDTFKMLTSLRHFSEGLHWKDRRSVLLDIAGEIGTPEGFDELLAALNGREVDEYRKVLAEQKKRLVSERDEINPRIDEISKGMVGYEQADDTDMREERIAVTLDIERLDSTRKELLESEQQRQANLEAINALCGKRVKREMVLKNSTAGIQHLLDSKKVIEDAVVERTQAVADARNARAMKDSEVRTKNASLQAEQRALSGIQEEYKTARNTTSDATCYACGQSLPEDKLAEVESVRLAKLKTIEAAGTTAMERVDICKAAIADLANECKNLQEKVGQAEMKLTEAKNYRDEKLPHIDNQIAHKETVKPENDPTWQGIVEEVKVLQNEVGESVSDRLKGIETKRQPKVDRLADLDSSLARADRHKEDKARITELEAKEKELAQAIADIEKQVADIEKYNAAVSGMVESAVNGRFKYVEFKLFNQLLNGTLEDCCEATLNGVPYLDMSCGQKIIVGIDIINVLSGHYDLSVPLFIDNAESLTFPVESTSQTIELYAQRDVQKMIVEKLEQRKAVA